MKISNELNVKTLPQAHEVMGKFILFLAQHGRTIRKSHIEQTDEGGFVLETSRLLTPQEFEKLIDIQAIVMVGEL